MDETSLGKGCMMDKDVTDLPLPDSPTMPKVCPGLMEILRSSTALTVPPRGMKIRTKTFDFDQVFLLGHR